MKKNDISKTWAELKKAKSMAEGLAVASVLLNQAAYKTGKFLYGLNTPKAPTSKTPSQSNAAHKTTGMTAHHAEADTGITTETGITAETILASTHHEDASTAQETMATSGYHTSTDDTGGHYDASAARVEAELIYSDSESEVAASTGIEIGNGPATGTDPSTATTSHLAETDIEAMGASDSITRAGMGDAGLGANTSPAANSGATPTTNTGASTEQPNPFSTELWQMDYDLRTLKSEYEKALSDTEKNVIHFKILRLERKRREYLNRRR